MKLKIILLVISLLFVSVSTYTFNNLNMFEYLNMFSDAPVVGTKPGAGTTKNATNSSDLSKIDNNQILIEEWLKVSSPSIRSSQRYPEIVLPNNDRKTINSTHTYFRINSLYKPGKDGEEPLDELYFYFRLSKNFFYYTTTKTDLNILGTIPMAFVLAVSKEIKDDRITDINQNSY